MMDGRAVWTRKRKEAHRKIMKRAWREGSGNQEWRELEKPRKPEPPAKFTLTLEDAMRSVR